MLADQKVGAISHLLLVHGVDGLLGGITLLVADVSLVEQGLAAFSTLNVGGLNFTVFNKHLAELVVGGAGRQALNEDVKEASFVALALLAALVSQNLNFFAVELEDLGLGESGRGGVLALELNVSKASALAVRIELQLAGSDGSECQESFVELLLRDAEVNVAHEQVRLGLHEVAFLQVAADEV